MSGENVTAPRPRRAASPLPPAVTRRTHDDGHAATSNDAGTPLRPFVAARSEAPPAGDRTQRTGRDQFDEAEPLPYFEEEYDAASSTPTPVEPIMNDADQETGTGLDADWADPAVHDLPDHTADAAGGGEAVRDFDNTAAARIADMLDGLSADLRDDAHGALERRIGGRDRLEALVAALIAGYMAAGTAD